MAAVRQIHPGVNIVIEPGLGEIKIGDVVLHSTEPDLDLEALSIASGRKFVCEHRFSALARQRPTAPLGGGPPPEAFLRPPAEALLVLQANNPSPVAMPEKKVAAFNLSGYFARKNLDTTADWKDTKKQDEIKNHVARLRQIIADTLEALHLKGEGFAAETRGEPLRRIDFYPDANLLIVIGSEEDLEAARVVISALPGMEGGRSSFQQNLTRIRGEEEPKEGMIRALPAAPAPQAVPAPPQSPALPAAPIPPQNPPQ